MTYFNCRICDIDDNNKIISCWICKESYCLTCAINWYDKCPYCNNKYTKEYKYFNFDSIDRLDFNIEYNLELDRLPATRRALRLDLFTDNNNDNKPVIKRLCSKCDEEINENNNHVCDKNIVENIRYIKNTTKKCPNCNINICKINNTCDQMYCVFCHTTWSWITNKILSDTNETHNPHYFNKLQLCDIFLDTSSTIEQKIYKSIQKSLKNRIENEDLIYSNLKFELRVKFINDLITGNEWKLELLKEFRTHNRNLDYIDLLSIILLAISYPSSYDISILIDYINNELSSIQLKHYQSNINKYFISLNNTIIVSLPYS